jgi:hypothetical protein
VIEDFNFLIDLKNLRHLEINCAYAKIVRFLSVVAETNIESINFKCSKPIGKTRVINYLLTGIPSDPESQECSKVWQHVSKVFSKDLI